MPKALKKILFIVSVLLIYFLGIRELRGVIHTLHMGTVFPDEYGVITENIRFYSQNSVSFIIENETENRVILWKYKMPFGFFFLLGMIGLIFVEINKKSFYVLAGIHLVGGILSLFFLILGINVYNPSLIVADMFSRYLIPLCSLGFVALVYIQKKNELRNEA